MTDQDKYFDLLYEDGIPIMSQSMAKNALPVNGGDSWSLQAAWDAQDVNRAKQTHARNIGTMIHAYFEDQNSLFIEPAIEISDTLKDITNQCFDADRDFSITKDSSLRLYMSVCEVVNYGKTWKPETRAQKWLDGGGPQYIEALRTAEGKIIVTAKEHEQITGMVNGLNNQGHIRSFFGSNHTAGIEILSEVTVRFVHNGIMFKALIDKIMIDKTTSSVTGLDLKSSKNAPCNFFANYTYVQEEGMIRVREYGGDYVSYQYYIQEYLYRIAIKSFMDQNELQDYSLDFKFAVIENKSPYRSAYMSANIGWKHMAKIEMDTACNHIQEFITRKGYGDL